MRLASQLTGWDIDILTEAEESERRQKEFAERTQTFMEALDVDEVVGQLLASEGFRSVEELAYVDPAELAAIEGFDEDTASRDPEPRARPPRQDRGRARRASAGSSASPTNCKKIDGVTLPMLVKLGENDVKTIEDLAGCATDDLAGWTERKDGETMRHAGFLDGFEVSREDAEVHDHGCPVKAGWVEAADPDDDLPTKPYRRNLKL